MTVSEHGGLVERLDTAIEESLEFDTESQGFYDTMLTHLLRDLRAALQSRDTSPSGGEPTAGEVPWVARVGEILDEGDGFWKSCSGCHELNEGHPTGPYSAAFRCCVGVGCSECGGLGVVWDDTDYAAMGDSLARDMGQNVPAALPLPATGSPVSPSGGGAVVDDERLHEIVYPHVGDDGLTRLLCAEIKQFFAAIQSAGRDTSQSVAEDKTPNFAWCCASTDVSACDCVNKNHGWVRYAK